MAGEKLGAATLVGVVLIVAATLAQAEVRRAVISVEFNYEEGPNGPFVPVLHNLVVENVTSKRSGRPITSVLPGWSRSWRK